MRVVFQVIFLAVVDTGSKLLATNEYNIKPSCKIALGFITHKPAHDWWINPYPTGSCLYTINPSGYVLGFIIYHIKNERVYVSYNKTKFLLSKNSKILKAALWQHYIKINIHGHWTHFTDAASKLTKTRNWKSEFRFLMNQKYSN